jgi:hypothetical protein
MKAREFNLILTLILLLAGISKSDSVNKLRVCVWNFIDENGEITPLTINIAEIFEEKLVGRQYYLVLQRRTLGRLVDITMQEFNIISAAKLPESVRSELRQKSIEAVFFGTLQISKGTSDVILRVSLERLDAAIIQICSIILDSQKIADFHYCENKVEELINRMYPQKVSNYSLLLPGLHPLLRKENKKGTTLLIADAVYVTSLIAINDKIINSNEKQKQSTYEGDPNIDKYYTIARDWQKTGRILGIVGVVGLYGYQLYDYYCWKRNVCPKDAFLHFIPLRDGFCASISKSF